MELKPIKSDNVIISIVYFKSANRISLYLRDYVNKRSIACFLNEKEINTLCKNLKSHFIKKEDIIDTTRLSYRAYHALQKKEIVAYSQLKHALSIDKNFFLKEQGIGLKTMKEISNLIKDVK